MPVALSQITQIHNKAELAAGGHGVLGSLSDDSVRLLNIAHILGNRKGELTWFTFLGVFGPLEWDANNNIHHLLWLN